MEQTTLSLLVPTEFVLVYCQFCIPSLTTNTKVVLLTQTHNVHITLTCLQVPIYETLLLFCQISPSVISDLYAVSCWACLQSLESLWLLRKTKIILFVLVFELCVV